MVGLIGAAIAGAAKLGYDQIKRNQDRSEKREFNDYVNASNYAYYIKSLQESPKAQREGLEAAGYNPLMALGSIGTHSFTGSSVASGDMDTGGDLMSSVKDGIQSSYELKKAISGKLEEEVKQSEIKTDADKKGLGILDATEKKIEAETETIKSQEWRNWVSTVGGLVGDSTEALLLYDFVKRNVLNRGPFGHGPIGFRSSSSNPSRFVNSVNKIAPLLKSSAKFGSLGLGLGLGATGIYYGLNNGLPRDTPNKPGFNKRDNDRKSQGGYYPHGNWSR